MISLSKLYPAVGHAWPPHKGIYAGPVATMITLSESYPAVGHGGPGHEGIYAGPFCQNEVTFMKGERSRSRPLFCTV